MAAPGHTPGHTAYVIGDDSERLIMFGDALHSPAQVARPDWVVATDADQQQAVQSRRKLLDELQRPNTAAFGIHFSDVQFGRVRDAQWLPGL
jgi:glyoxylase-like metal-dependent hydrolase (beta-lactamase superfamily II)